MQQSPLKQRIPATFRSQLGGETFTELPLRYSIAPRGQLGIQHWPDQKSRRFRKSRGRPSGSNTKRYASSAHLLSRGNTGSTSWARTRLGGSSPPPTATFECMTSKALLLQRSAALWISRRVTSLGERFRCSAHSCIRRSRANRRLPSPSPAGSSGTGSSSCASRIEQDTSESWVQDRRLRLSDPTTPRRRRSHTPWHARRWACHPHSQGRRCLPGGHPQLVTVQLLGSVPVGPAAQRLGCPCRGSEGQRQSIAVHVAFAGRQRGSKLSLSTTGTDPRYRSVTALGRLLWRILERYCVRPGRQTGSELLAADRSAIPGWHGGPRWTDYAKPGAGDEPPGLGMPLETTKPLGERHGSMASDPPSAL
jgi:hypothetical protein